MSAFQDLASSAPEVEAAEASRPQTDKNSDDLEVEPARPCEDPTVEAATAVDAAVPFDNPKEFAPPMSQETASSHPSGHGASRDHPTRHESKKRLDS